MCKDQDRPQNTAQLFPKPHRPREEVRYELPARHVAIMVIFDIPPPCLGYRLDEGVMAVANKRRRWDTSLSRTAMCILMHEQCDQAIPCSRCARLRIECVGAGLQRFKFTTPVTAPVNFDRSRVGSPMSGDVNVTILCRHPQSENSSLINLSLIHISEPTRRTPI